MHRCSSNMFLHCGKLLTETAIHFRVHFENIFHETGARHKVWSKRLCFEYWLTWIAFTMCLLKSVTLSQTVESMLPTCSKAIESIIPPKEYVANLQELRGGMVRKEGRNLLVAYVVAKMDLHCFKQSWQCCLLGSFCVHCNFWMCGNIFEQFY